MVVLARASSIARSESVPVGTCHPGYWRIRSCPRRRCVLGPRRSVGCLRRLPTTPSARARVSVPVFDALVGRDALGRAVVVTG